MTANLPLRQRPFDYFFIIMFSLFFITSMISDMVPAFFGGIDPNSTNALIQANYNYAKDCDPLFLHPPVWMRMIIGLSSFVYGPFYLILVYCLIRGVNRIQVPAIIYGTAISVLTGVVVFGVEFWGEPEWRCQNLGRFVPLNLPYVLIPILLIIRMRKEFPFARKF